jgi:hypothetical protein
MLTAVKEAMEAISRAGHNNGYNWAADPKSLTLIEGSALEMLQSVIELLERAE